MRSRTARAIVLIAAFSSASCREIDRTFAFASIGVARAQYELGVAYADGSSLEANPEAAASWLQKAADQGHSGAQYRLALMYTEGTGVERNYAKAYRLLNLAALQGHPKAEPLRSWVAQELAEEQREKSSGSPAPQTRL